ncbi:hypothetical protein CJF30_00003941 [Rutstroemia sp. NJR-2017a BBW]|nr:hypothetical protein CJF30_00003941 [Rutstroemia sp. NJR-2017a BBW]
MTSRPQTHLIIGASRGIGLEFARQLLSFSPSTFVIATYRSAAIPDILSKFSEEFKSRLTLLRCDINDEESIKALAVDVSKLITRDGWQGGVGLETVVVNAGVLEWPNGVLGSSNQSWHHHFQTNTFGPLLAANHLLSVSNPKISISTIVFISSDSGSAGDFRSYEDKFAAYAASKAALNMGLRHLAAELHRERGSQAPVVLALHPGEVNTDMAKNTDVPWEVHGSIEVDESIEGCLKVIREKGKGGVDEGGKETVKGFEAGAATFWTWDGRNYPW